MKQISQNYKTGQIRSENVALPLLKRGGVLVQTSYSVISSGTEAMKVKESKMSYLGKAKSRPDQVKKVLQTVQQQGIVAAYEKVMNKLDALTPLGYSLSGIVTAVGEGANEFTVGQRVACGGAGYANHAEIVFVPKNLVVPVPEDVSMLHAAFTTIGAIAMQGFRQSEIRLGESACIIGLGLLGQLLVQILKAAGVHVIGVDLVETRCQIAKELGAAVATFPDDPSLESLVKRVTDGGGADCIFIAASGTSNKPVELAVKLARDRARIVDIGKTTLHLPWNAYYEKEIEVRFSRSYGPGRYDPNYEERGIDYPIGYVRWTERRNMAAFLDLMANGKVKIAPLISAVHAFSEAERVYESIAQGHNDGLATVFEYDANAASLATLPLLNSPARPRVTKQGNIRIGVIGAGNYASSMLLPHLSKSRDLDLVEVATTRSLSAKDAARKFGFERAGTDYRSLIERSDIDAVVIATRHESHAQMVAEALQAGKAVFVEKPLAIDFDGLERVRRAVTESENDRLQVGFNRRFSPLLREAASMLKNVNAPLMLHYRVHTGQLESDSWYLDRSQGSRFIGEAGHFFDVFSFIIGSRPASVMAISLRPHKIIQDDLENLAVIVQYEDGSIGNLLYLTQGGSKIPKESLEIFGGNRAVQLHNFESLILFEGSGRRKVTSGRRDKGQKQQLQAFFAAVQSGSEMPIRLDSLLDTTLLTLAAEESLRTGQPVRVADYWQQRSEIIRDITTADRHLS